MEYKIFGKWDPNVEFTNLAMKDYINLSPRIVFHTAGRLNKEYLYKKKIHIIERLINNLMRGGTGKKIGGRVIRGRKGPGKKIKMYKVVKEAFDIIHQRTGENPVQLLVKALENAAPREETTRVRYGGVLYHIAVDVSPQRAVDLALRHIGRAVAIRSFNTKKSAAEALADEIILAANNDPQSFAISRKNEIERIAMSSR